MFGRAAKPSNPLLQPTSKLGELENPSIVTTHVASGFWGVAQMRGRSADGHKQPSGGCARLKIEHYATRRGGG
uniref:Uncharacterized protein n=1 Tax=Pyricularia oryzae (strain P131) TaxID=1143193 RepID=L7JFV0_PYRO1